MKDVTNSFNFMIREILSLKIRTYEETIAHQSSELQYLQSQIKPHFVLNAISTIHSMTYKKNNEVIRNYIDALSRHIRYLFKMKFQLVPLESELKHIKNYFKMQDILYPDCVMYYMDMDEEACERLIPPLLLHTIMENEYKYAVSLDNLLSIFITGKLIREDGETMLHLVIEDDGVGFSNSSLERVNSPNIDSREDGTGMGIRNLHAMMRMFFNRTDLLRFSNRENSGARVDISIPAPILGDREK
jgi:LytS/YehU family sensor histidine kinase